jgi:hypothetical protein
MMPLFRVIVVTELIHFSLASLGKLPLAYLAKLADYAQINKIFGSVPC